MRTGRVSAVTDTGRRRLRNEDAYVCEPPLFAVADGMGGAQAGELASRLAAAAIEELEVGIRGEEALAALVQAANVRVWRRSLDDPAAAGMGTTVTVALVDERGGTLALGHVGDSRAYLARGDALEQLTDDHSLVAELLRSGRLTEEEAAAHPHRSVITRALGTEAEVDVDTFTLGIQPGDLFLICSDGLTTMLGDDDIQAVVEREERDPERLSRALVEAANHAGGEDNVTVIVFEIEEGEPEERQARVRMPAEETAEVPEEASRHGAGPGGRWWALALILLVLAATAVVVYLGFAR